MKKLLLLCVVLSIWMFGCGSESDGLLTLADITVTDISGGNFTVESSAVFISGKPIANAKISYTASFKGTNTTQKIGELYTDPSGKVVIGPWQVSQDTVPVVITINITTGDLSATKISSIPATTP